MIERIERTKREFTFFLKLVVHNFEDDAIVLSEHDVGLAAADVGPVDYIFALDVGAIGMGSIESPLI